MFRITRETEYKISRWSGGVTKELCIYPETADYGQRNFLFRVSIATTETETSSFTSLPGVARVLSILEGTLHITHAGHHTAKLPPYAIDHFDGGWATTASGKVTDFNLMLKECSGDFAFSPVQGELDVTHKTASLLFVYCIDGPVSTGDEALQTGDFLLTDKPVRLTGKNAKVFHGFVALPQ